MRFKMYWIWDGFLKRPNEQDLIWVKGGCGVKSRIFHAGICSFRLKNRNFGGAETD